MEMRYKIQNFPNPIGHRTLIRQVCEPPAFEMLSFKDAFVYFILVFHRKLLSEWLSLG